MSFLPLQPLPEAAGTTRMDRLSSVVYQPTTKHTHTIILLHGLGSTAQRFGDEFMASSGIAKLLPTVKFVFPSALRKKTKVLKKARTTQWFDIASFEQPGSRPDIQMAGLEETANYIWGIVHGEASLLAGRGLKSGNGGYDRVVLGGLSQGCAASIITSLGGDKKLAGYIGMSGWLPFEAELSDILNDSSEDSFFGSDDTSKALQAINQIRNNLNLDPLDEAPQLSTPIFLGHGDADEKISVYHGRAMACLLEPSDKLNMSVSWIEYKAFGHWYKIPDEIDDIVRFLEMGVGIGSDVGEGQVDKKITPLRLL